jgi:hypothetical protein
MAERQWTMQRGSAEVWQRLLHGPLPGRRARAQARPARRGGERPLAGGLLAGSLLVAIVAGWAGV